MERATTLLVFFLLATATAQNDTTVETSTTEETTTEGQQQEQLDCDRPWTVNVTVDFQNRVDIRWTGEDLEKAEIGFEVEPAKCAKFPNGRFSFQDGWAQVPLRCPNTQYNVSVLLVCNEINVNTTSFLVWTPPEAPKEVTLIKVSATDIMISWIAPPEPVTGYRVKMNDLVHPVATTYFIVSKLKPSTKYTLQVAAKNHYVWGRYSQELIIETLKKEIKPPTIRVGNVTETSIEVVWRKYRKLCRNASCEFDVRCFDTVTNETMQFDTEQFYYTITGLVSYRNYAIRVRAFVNNQTSRLSEKLEVKTLPFAPSEPQFLETTNSTDTSLTVKWKEPAFVQEPILLYAIEWEEHDGSATSDNATSIQLFYRIQGLLPFTRYQIMVYAVTESGPGNASEIAAMTDAGLPSIPTNFTLTNTTRTSIGIQWEEPDPSNGPIISYTVEWTSIDNDTLHNDTTTDLYYIIGDLEPYSNHSVRVCASTEAGSGNWTNVLEIRTDIGIPSLPLGLKVSDTQNTSLKVCWDPPRPFVGPISSYSVEVSWKINSTFKQSAETDKTCFLIDELEPYTEYVVRVRAATQAGRGPPSKALEARTGIGTPGIPRHLEMVEANRTSLKICWEEPEPFVGPIASYRLEIQRKAGAFEDVYSTNSTCIVIRGLSPFTEYSVRVRAVTSAGEGKPTKAMMARTAVGVPSVPRSLIEVGKTNTSVDVQWKAPEHMNGPLLEYVVEWTDVEEYTYNHTTPLSTLSITQLTPFTDYSVRVRAATSAGAGNWCKPIRVKTDIGIPFAPRELRKTGVTSSSIGLEWQEPDPIRGDIKQYDIRWKEAAQDTFTQHTTKGGERYYTITGLEPYSNYTIQVRAATKAGFGNWSGTLFLRTLSGVPSSPGNVTAAEVTNRTIQVTWFEPKPFRGPVLSYSVRWKRVGHTSVQIESVKQLKFTVLGLDPYTTYSIAVRAVTSAGNGSWSGDLEVQTAIGIPTSPRNVSRQHTTAYSIALTWKTPQPSNGPVLKYQVDWGVLDGEETSTNQTEDTLFEEFGLLPYTNYSFRVSAYTEAGWGPQAAPYVVRTDIAKPSVPIHLSLVSATASSISVSWEDPSHPNGPLLPYTVRWCIGAKVEVGWNENDTSNGHWRISNLHPYTYYSVSVAARTSAGRGPWTEPLVVQTAVAVPSQAQVVGVVVESSRTLAVKWQTPSVYPGPTKYVLKVWRRPNTCEESGVVHKVAEMEGSKGREEWSILRVERVEDLTPHTLYFARVTLITEAGRSESPDSSDYWTLPDAPGAPSHVRADCKGSSTETVVWWKPPRRPNGKIVEYKVTYGIESFDSVEEVVVAVTDQCQENRLEIQNLRPEKKYRISVRAKVQDVDTEGQTGSLDEYCILPAGVPPMGDGRHVSAVESGPYGLQMEWSRDAFSDVMGALVNYALIVGTAVGNATWGRESELHPTWRNFSAGMSDFYQTTPLEWNPFDEGKEDPLNCAEVTEEGKKDPNKLKCFVGSSACSATEPFCNGPLQPDTTYGMKLRAYTRGGFSETQPFFASTGSVPRTSPVGAIVGSVLVLLLIGAAVSSVFVLRRKGKLEYVRDVILSRLGSRQRVPPQPPVEQVLQLETVQTIQTLTVHNFAEHVRIMMSDSHLRFSQEFEALKRNSPKFPCFVAEMDENRTKNRWLNIFPYDHSRVKLLPLGDDPASDFINANYIPGYSSLREYIASQGPLSSTVDDFWRMVWEQSVTMIVMLTQCVERGKNKCEQYWPQSGEAKHYGDVQVRCISESMLSCYSIRMLHLQLGSQERKVKQMHFTHWPDFGCPESPEDLINFVMAVRDHLPRVRPGPILVHCSAGVGRTGTFIAVDRLHQQMRYTDDLDIYGTVMELRQHRINMVQTEDQYIYIHLCVSQLINEMNQPEDNEYEEAIYSNICVEKDTGV